MKTGTTRIYKGGEAVQINTADLPAWIAQGWSSATAEAGTKTEQEPAKAEAPKRGRPKSK